MRGSDFWTELRPLSHRNTVKQNCCLLDLHVFGMATEDWKAIASRKRLTNLEKIPQEWRLPSSITDGINSDSSQPVLAIPALSKILTDREIELTEKYDASSLLRKISANEARYCLELAAEILAELRKLLRGGSGILQKSSNCTSVGLSYIHIHNQTEQLTI